MRGNAENAGQRVIEPCESSWASPVVLVTKKDGTTHLCVVYRKLNNVTKKDAYPLPWIDDTLDTLRSSTYFSTLDPLFGVLARGNGPAGYR